MALIWIVTTGNSDVKLTSDKGWTDLRTKNNNQLKPCHKKFSNLEKGNDKLWSLPARVIGVVYGDAWDTHQDYFKFPLLEEFTRQLKSKNNNPDRIIILLTNQEKVFLENSEDSRYYRTEDSPYWRDTSQLEPILKHYFYREFGDNKIEFIFLEPEIREEGLDNWDSTLKLVQEKFQKIKITDNDSVIVSHQASTPAISSAVQFTSLANFGERVNFLISNERDPELTRFLEGSKYLKGIRKKEAETLLERHDYSGVKALISDYIKNDNYAQILLEAAIQWNFAKFDNFANEIQKLSDSKFESLAQKVQERSQYWWWSAYEAAYLALIRLDQGNTVEAFFHSFRSIEGAFSNWGKKVFSEYINTENDRAFLQPVILESTYFNNAEFESDGITPKNSLARLKKKLLELAQKIEKSGDKNQKPKGILLAGDDLYILFRSENPDYKSSNLKRFWNSEDGIGEKRNKNFHQLQGLSENDVFKDWEVSDSREWEQKILKYLNFIAKKDLVEKSLLVEFESFKSLEDVSLMKQVHQALEKAIAEI